MGTPWGAKCRARPEIEEKRRQDIKRKTKKMKKEIFLSKKIIKKNQGGTSLFGPGELS